MFSKSSNYSIFITFPLLGYFGYVFYNLIQNSSYFTGIRAINTAIHEGGHVAVMLIGNQFLTAAAGTVMQLLLPILIMVGFFRQKDYFGFSLGFAWLGINFFHISDYIGDAMNMNSPILKFFGEGKYMHDWYYMLNKIGILGYYDIISNAVHILAIICFIIFFLYSGLLIINRFREGDI